MKVFIIIIFNLSFLINCQKYKEHQENIVKYANAHSDIITNNKLKFELDAFNEITCIANQDLKENEFVMKVNKNYTLCGCNFILNF